MHSLKKKKHNKSKKEVSAKEAVDVQTTDPINKTVPKYFSFGQNKIKTFSSEADWHTRGKQTADNCQNKQDALKMDELMETLPD